MKVVTIRMEDELFEKLEEKLDSMSIPVPKAAYIRALIKQDLGEDEKAEEVKPHNRDSLSPTNVPERETQTKGELI